MEKTNKSWERNWQDYILETKIKKQTNLKENDGDPIQDLEGEEVKIAAATAVENLYDEWGNVERVMEFVERHLRLKYGDY